MKVTGLERFAGRCLGVATLHGKEAVIGPPLMNALGLNGYSAIAGVDTDRFGAFSGEVQRTLDPLAACKAKAKHGAEVSGMDLVIASEGSFFPYPPAPFVPCNEEVLVIYDALDGSFHEHRHLSLRTVFGGELCADWSQVKAFAERMKFPKHGLVVRTEEKWVAGHAMLKGITTQDALREFAERLIAENGQCWVETDMRAMMNPTRMGVIADAADGLAQEIASTCPSCGACWFRITEAISGLPCELCGAPTQSTRGYRRSCDTCAFTTTVPRPDRKASEDPTYCGHCNP